uniref:Small ribosomal subunit protein uS3c n=1 Tax=Pleurastrum terricola TaxID=34116 RepID=A6YGC6_PLETE|nr:ribosomal protein S3 [Pleurastrum terricola]ABO69339.1 ribosomal protein S3 [Pleurastrum terricola]
MGQKVHPLGFRVGITKKHRSLWFSNSKQYPQSVLEDYVIRNNILKTFPSAEISEIHIQRTHHDIESSPNGLIIIIYSKKPNQLVGNKHEKLHKLRKILKQKLTLNRSLIKPKGQVFLNSSWRDFSKILLQKQKTDRIKFLVREITTPYSSAFCIGNAIVQQLQDRQRYRFVIKKVIAEVKKERKENLKTIQPTNTNKVITSREIPTMEFPAALEKAQNPLEYNLSAFNQSKQDKSSYQVPIKGLKIQLAGRLNGAEIARTEWFRKGRVPLHTLKADIDYSYQKAYTKYGIIGVKVWVFNGIKTGKYQYAKLKFQKTKFLSQYIYT